MVEIHKSSRIWSTSFLLAFMVPLLVVISIREISNQTTILSCPDDDKKANDKQLHLYILIDESDSDYGKDPSGLIRISILKQVVEFAVGYGWLAEKPPYLSIYRYSTLFPNATEEVWPYLYPDVPIRMIDEAGSMSSVSDLLNYLIPQIGKLPSNLWQVEDMAATLAYIQQEIIDNKSQENALVILITEGTLVPRNGSDTQVNLLNKAIQKWNFVTVPFGVFCFRSSAPGDKCSYENEWKSNFLHELNSDMDVNDYFLSYSLDNMNNDQRDVWETMSKIYERLGLFNGSVQVGEIRQGEQSSDNFLSALKNLRIVSLNLGNEALTYNGEYAKLVDKLNWWDLNMPSTSTLDSLVEAKKTITFMYNCSIAPASTYPPAVTPASTPVFTPTPIPPGPSERELINSEGIGLLIGTGIILVLLLILQGISENLPIKDSLSLLSLYLIPANIGMGILIYLIRIPRIWDNTIASLFGAVIFMLIFGSAFTFILDLLKKKKTKIGVPTGRTNESQDKNSQKIGQKDIQYSKIEKFLRFISPINAGIFMVLVTLFLIIRLYHR